MYVRMYNIRENTHIIVNLHLDVPATYIKAKVGSAGDEHL
jgi:hypothetical protein